MKLCVQGTRDFAFLFFLVSGAPAWLRRAGTVTAGRNSGAWLKHPQSCRFRKAGPGLFSILKGKAVNWVWLREEVTTSSTSRSPIFPARLIARLISLNFKARAGLDVHSPQALRYNPVRISRKSVLIIHRRLTRETTVSERANLSGRSYLLEAIFHIRRVAGFVNSSANENLATMRIRIQSGQTLKFIQGIHLETLDFSSFKTGAFFDC